MLGDKMIDVVKKHIDEIFELCRQYNVRSLEFFGSAFTERKFDRETSDIDFLVEFFSMEPNEHAKSYFGLLEDLQDMFEYNIDLVEAKAVHNPYLKESINKNKGKVYAA